MAIWQRRVNSVFLTRTEVSIAINAINEAVALLGEGDELEIRLGAEPDLVLNLHKRLKEVAANMDKRKPQV
jgi:hypothetical protein